MRALWLTVGALLSVAAVVISTGLVWTGFARARPPMETSVRAIPFQARAPLKINAGRGDVHVSMHAGEAGVIVVERRLEWSREKPAVVEDWDGGALRLESSCAGIGVSDEAICQVNYDLYVPQETDVEISTSTGWISIDGLRGDVRATSISGDVAIRETPGSVWARSGSGSIWGDDLRAAEADAQVDSGRVELSFRTAPTRVSAVVTTVGDVSVNVPKGAYDVSASGPDILVMIADDPASPRKVTTRTPEGTIHVCC